MSVNILENFSLEINDARIWVDTRKYDSDAWSESAKEGYGKEINQGVLFRDDMKRHLFNLGKDTRYEIISLAEVIGTLVLIPFAIFIDLYRACVNKKFSATQVLNNLYLIPKHIFLSIFNLVMCAARIVHKTVNAVSIAVGHFVWHGGEALVRQIKLCVSKDKPENSNTILSDNQEYRYDVYDSIGITFLAAIAVFIPILAVQMIALPIIVGSLYGTINNQFTNRLCPEYYTMGHDYDGKNLQKHAVRTNNNILKPIITGCYATTTVTKIAGVILAAAGVLPFASVALPITIAAAMVGVVVLVSIIAAHIFSTLKKKKIDNSIEEFAKILKIELTEEDKEKTWFEFCDKHIEKLAAFMKVPLNDENRKLTWMNFWEQASRTQPSEIVYDISLAKDSKDGKRLVSLYRYLTENSFFNDGETPLPIKYMAKWQANGMRNGVGYGFVAGGTLSLTIATVLLRIFAL